MFHHIITKGPKVSARVRKLTPEKLKAAKREFKLLCEAGICRPSKSPWASPMHLVPKSDGNWRVCGDYRPLNAVTIPDKYSTPPLFDCTANLHGKKYFSKLDLQKAFNQIPVAPEDIPKTAIITPFGLFEFVYMLPGLLNGSQSCQRYVDNNLGDLDFVFTFIDDFLVASSTIEEHYEDLRIVFARLKEANLRLNVAKCIFAVEELDFLGYTINSSGIRPTISKVEAVLNYPKPSTVMQLRRFLGMVHFYHRNLPNTATEQAPLNAYFLNSKKNDKTEIKWTPEAEKAFEKIKSDLANAALLVHPRIDAKIQLITDASDVSCWGVIEQKAVDGNSWQPLAFFSKKFSKAQKNYSAYDRELTAIYEAIKYFSYILEGRDFKILTDHKPLTYAFSQRPEKASPRQVRQLSYIAEFTTKIEHVCGKDNVVAVCLSRIDSLSLTTSLNLKTLDRLQKEDEQLQNLLKENNTSLDLKLVPFDSTHSIVCDTSGNVVRPYIPQALQRKVFDIFHLPAHPNGKATDRLIKKKYVWVNMHREIIKWAKGCLACQQSKTTRHVKLIPDHFVTPDARFDSVHVDLVGPLPEIEGYKYMFTMIDRFSRWIEVVPIKDMEAPTVTRAFFDTWVCRFGTPKILTTDQGSQFEGRLFDSLTRVLGCEKRRTTAYHPACNGMIERVHRCLKSALMCYSDTDWTRNLSSVLLGLRSYVREDTGASPAEFLFGTTLRLPGEFFAEDDFSPDPISFIDEFKGYMRQVRPVPVAHNYKRPYRAFYFKDLYTCTHVFMRNMARQSLERPYSGPHRII